MKSLRHGITAPGAVAPAAFSGGGAVAPATALRCDGAPARRALTARGLTGFGRRLEAAGAP